MGVLSHLAQGRDLAVAEADWAMTEILDGHASAAQIGAFCMGLRAKTESVDEMLGMRRALMAAAAPLFIAAEDVIDTCGTGGDRSGSINVSTLAAIVVAAAGAQVVKHGNRASTSQCGSADVLEALGVVIDLDGDGVAKCLADVGIAFCLAPRFHPAVRHAGPVRRELGFPTVFNFLGPLANPAKPRRQVVGVSDPIMAERMLQVLATTGTKRAMVLYGDDGLDELSVCSPSTVVAWQDGAVNRLRVDPGALGLAPADRSQIAGGDAFTNARLARDVLGGLTGPMRDVVLLNAAAAAIVADLAPDWETGLTVAASAIDSGKASALLDAWVEVSQKCRPPDGAGS
ncbi:MAG: anthranilate phosphoribosyltransferase [Acidimicrobiales bacterium]